MQPNIFTLQDVNTKVTFMIRILYKKIHVGSGSGSKTNWKVGSISDKNHSGSTTLLLCIKISSWLLGCVAPPPFPPQPFLWKESSPYLQQVSSLRYSGQMAVRCQLQTLQYYHNQLKYILSINLHYKNSLKRQTIFLKSIFRMGANSFQVF